MNLCVVHIQDETLAASIEERFRVLGLGTRFVNLLVVYDDVAVRGRKIIALLFFIAGFGVLASLLLVKRFEF